MPMKAPDKVLAHTEKGRRFRLNLYANDDKAEFVDVDHEGALFALKGVNNMEVMELTLKMRKAARFVVGVERDMAKLKEEGFIPFEVAPQYTPPAKPVAKERQKVQERLSNRPKWLTN